MINGLGYTIMDVRVSRGQAPKRQSKWFNDLSPNVMVWTASQQHAGTCWQLASRERLLERLVGLSRLLVLSVVGDIGHLLSSVVQIKL